jgi:PAS domain S-box-containing protein
MKEQDQGPGGMSGTDARALRMALAFCGLLAVLWLATGVGPPASRAAAGGIAALAIITLAWMHRREAGASSREAELLAKRLVEENRRLEKQLQRTEEEHRSLEHYFETLMEHVPANIYFKDAGSRFLKVNQSMAGNFGCGHPADMLGKTDHDFFEAGHADQALRDEREIMETGRGISGKIEHETFSDGKESWALTTKMPFRDREGRIIGTFGISSNVTELMTTRNTLERERNVLRSLIDSFPDKIFVRDPGRHYLVVNKAMAEWVGAESPGEMLGRTPDDYYPESVARDGAREDLELLASGKPVLNREWTLDRGGGDLHHLVTTKVPLVDPDGRCWGIVGMDRDVTEQRRAREKLQQAEQQLQELMDNSPAVIYLKDREGRYRMVNRGFEELFGLGREDVLGRRDDEFIADGEAAAEFRAQDERVLDTGEPMQVDQRLFVDGEPRWYVTVRFPLRDVRSHIHAVAGISTDITDRKLAEDAMRKLNEDLRRANEDLQRAHEQLIQAEKMESIGRLASGVAHEVKNPLAMISMGLELLARRIPEEDRTGREALERMKRGIERAKRIVKGLVDFSSARQLSLESCNVNRVVTDSIALVEYQLRKAGIELVDELAEGLPEVEMDATKIEQVLLNLMINAMQAMERGGSLTVRTYLTVLSGAKRDEGVRTRGHLRAGDQVIRIEIDDTGPGIPPEIESKIFDPFFTTKPTGVGTGLGLSVSSKIIGLHHGTLELRNREGGGTRARITLRCPGEG